MDYTIFIWVVLAILLLAGAGKYKDEPDNGLFALCHGVVYGIMHLWMIGVIMLILLAFIGPFF